VKGIKEESGGKIEVDHAVLRELYRYVTERTLYLILSFILSQWRDLRIGVMIKKLIVKFI